jgi:hypothetical protein
LIEPIDNQTHLLKVLSHSEVRHFIYAQAVSGGVHIILAIAQNRYGWSFQVCQNSRQHLEALGVLSRAICDNSYR